MDELKNISVVVPAYNNEKTIAATIEALLAQDYPAENLEIIIVDDGSNDRTGEIIKNYPVKYSYQDNKGPAAARNLGWRLSKGQIICFTDADCIPEKQWVSKLCGEYTSDKIAGVGGSYRNANSDNLLATCIHQEIIQRHLRIPKQVNYLGAFNVSYRRGVLEEIGGFNESYPDASCEDNDIAYRIVKKGYKLIFDKDIRVGHHHPVRLLGYLRRQFWHGFWRMKLYRNHPDMAKGDVYAGLMDFIRPPLAMATICLLPLVFFRLAAYMFCFLLFLEGIMQVFVPLSVIKRTRKLKYAFLILITFFREYSRGVGMIVAIFRFFIYDALLKLE